MTKCVQVTLSCLHRGDTMDMKVLIAGKWLALAGPANRQGHVHHRREMAGRDAHFRGTQGTAIIGLFGGAAAWTGASERTLQRLQQGL